MGQRRRPLESLAVRPASPDPSFWRGRRVLVTGHTGFKGAWTALWLARMGASVTGLALVPEEHPNLFELAGVALDYTEVERRADGAGEAAVEIAADRARRSGKRRRFAREQFLGRR